MTSLEFLRHLWPASGFYCISTPFEGGWGNHVFDTIEAAAAYVEKYKAHENMFFCIHSLAAKEVWNPEKKNRDGTKGGYSKRLQRNMLQGKAFFFDLDCGEGKPYPAQADAVADVKRFVSEAGLPDPMLVNSGGGVHVYWVLTEAIDSKVWRGYAERLRALATQFKLGFDPSRTTDTASVLRVAGTTNLKPGKGERPVTVLETAEPVDLKEFDDAIGVKLVNAPAAAKIDPKLANRPLVPGTTIVSNILGKTEDEVTKLKMTDIISTCGQMARLALTHGNMSEPEWYASLGVIKGVGNAERVIHKWSDGYPGYTPEATIAKFEQHKEKVNGMTNCAYLRSVSGPMNDHICEKCPWWDAAKGSIYKATRLNATPVEREDDLDVPISEEVDGETYIIPDEERVTSRAAYAPPTPYRRNPLGPGIEKLVPTKDNKGVDINTVFDYDFYPLRRLRNRGANTMQTVWRFFPPLPKGEKIDITIDASVMVNPDQLRALLENNGVHPKLPGELMNYMSAYIRELQRLTPPSEQYNHIGWVEDHTKFVLNGQIMQPDGTVVRASMGPHARDAETMIGQKGTLEKQVELMNFWNYPEYVDRQVVIVAQLASMILYATGLHGLLINAYGEAGCSKSTALYTAASLLGNPEQYTMNALTRTATANARLKRLELLANPAFCLDEMTKLPEDDIRDLAFLVTQPDISRRRLKPDGSQQPTIDYGNVRSSFILATSNMSLQHAVSTNNMAGAAAAVRILEMQFEKNGIHTKEQADQYLRELMQNYGHIGPAFLKGIIPYIRSVEQKVHETMAKIDRLANVREEERFYSAAIAALVVACRLAVQLGLLPFDAAYMQKWLIETQLIRSREVVKEEVDSSDPAKLVTDWLEQHDGEIIKVSMLNGKVDQIVPPKGGKISGHFEVSDNRVWILRDAFKTYCDQRHVPMGQMVRQLHRRGIVPVDNRKFTLGKLTDFAKGQSQCFQVDLSHPDVAGVRPTLYVVSSVEEPQASSASRPVLKVVPKAASSDPQEPQS